VLAILERPGVWKRAGMSGMLSGLDLAEALASLPDGLDRELAKRLLMAAETPFLIAWMQQHRTEKADGAA
jgi:hypothetical protein